jgi:hypothetical protein
MLPLVLATACAACAASENNIYGGLVGQRVVGNEAFVSVSNVWNEMDALPLAERHCGTYGRIARFKHMEPARAVYDCVGR